MNAKTKAQIIEFISDIDEFAPNLLARAIADRFGVSRDEAMSIIYPPAPSNPRPSSEACHYCGAPAKSFGFFDEPVCRECGGR